MEKSNTTNGFKETEIGMIPEDWEVAKFENLILKSKNKAGKIEQHSYKKCGKYPIVDQGKNLIAGYWDDENVVYKGTLPVVIFGDHTRIFKFVNFPFICGADGTKVLQPNINLINPLYFYFALTNLDIQSRGYNRHYRLLKEKLLPLPPPLEQQKIAAVLSAVQEAKEKTDDVIKAAKELKKSLMKYLFTYGAVSPKEAGNVQPKETEIGMIPEDWEVVKLGERVILVMGQSPPGSTYNEVCQGMPFLQGKAEFGELSPKYVKYTTKPLKVAPRGSILISVRAPVGDVNIANIDFCIGRGLASLSLKNGENIFLFYLLKYLKSEIEKEGTGSTFKEINKSKLQEFKIPLPPLPIQQKIAEILSAVDKKIEAEENKKKSLEDLFKTLLNNLMTGKIRVNNLEV